MSRHLFLPLFSFPILSHLLILSLSLSRFLSLNSGHGNTGFPLSINSTNSVLSFSFSLSLNLCQIEPYDPFFRVLQNRKGCSLPTFFLFFVCIFSIVHLPPRLTLPKYSHHYPRLHLCLLNYNPFPLLKPNLSTLINFAPFALSIL